MFFDFDKYTYYISPGTMDMRKGSNSLAIFVQDQLKGNPFSKSMFLFCSKNKKTLAVLVWDNGFWLMKKKVLNGTFAWPKDGDEALLITLEDVKRLISGEDIWRKIPVLPDYPILW